MKNRKFPRAALLSIALVCFASLAFLATTPVSSQDRRRARESVERAINQFDELTLDTATVLREARKSGRVALSTSRGEFELEVEPFDIRTDNYRSVTVGADGVSRDLPRTPSRSWRGHVVGRSDTFVRLVLDDQTLEGIIVTPDETFYVEPERDFSPAASTKDFVFYAASSVKQQNIGECGTTLAQTVGAESSHMQLDTTHAAKGVTPEAAFSPEADAEIATESDFEFTQTYASNQNVVGQAEANAANQDILKIITMADAIYDAQLGISLHVVFQRAWTTISDPYIETNAGNAVEEFASKYNGSFGTNPVPARDLAHMFTGRTLLDDQGNQGIIGIAFISTICDTPELSYGISESKFNGPGTGLPNDSVTVQRVALTAHEMGHNFGACHPNQATCVSSLPPGCNASNSIMNASIQTTSNFCQFSRDQITNDVAGNGGSCLTRLTGNCTYNVSPLASRIGVDGGSGTVSVSTTADCSWTASEGASALTITSGASGNGPGSVGYTVAAHSANEGPLQIDMDVAGKRVKITQAASSNCANKATPITVGQTINGSLGSPDCVSGQTDRPNAFIDLYTFAGRAGQLVKIEMTGSGNLNDTFLYLFAPDGGIVAENDDIDTQGGNLNSRIPLVGFFALPATGIYTIEATSFDDNVAGAYTLTLSDNASSNSAALASSSFSVSEAVGNGLGTDGTGFRIITVNRTGADISGTATVDFATSDGSADFHKDYEQTLGTLVFGPNETSKSFTVLIPDDRFSEGPETINITLSNPVGMTLGSPSTATLTVNSDDSPSGSSPVQAASFNNFFYVRQNYLDFLNREPDQSGFNFWVADLNSCSTEPCREVHRVNVSAAFFLSIEFQETGFLVHRMYKAAYGDATGISTLGNNTHQLPVPVVRLNEFLPDTQRIGQGVVIGQPGADAQLEANKQAFALEFVLRQRFTDINNYPLSMTPAEVVDRMNTRAGSVLTPPERDNLVAQLTASADVAAGRASVLRSIAENALLRQNEKNRAFVLMQFFGYLRRNPNDLPDADYTGYDFWLTKLSQFNGNFVQAEMVKAFITSTEYIDRFGTRP